MELESSPIFNEIELITQSGPKKVSYYWEAIIHAGEASQLSFKVTSINNFRDYEKRISDETVLEVALGLGHYSKVVYPNRNILEITLRRIALKEVGASQNVNEPLESERYKAVLVLKDLPPVEGSELGQIGQEALDLQDIVAVKFQLFSKTLEKLRLVTVGGIFRKCSAEDVIRSVLSTESAKIKIQGEKSITGVDVIETVNKEKREHIVIPQGTKLIRVPTFIQERCGGIYSTGIGTYLQDRLWYVYPLYDTTRLNQSEKTLTVFKVPSNRFTGIERTYRQEGGSVFILGTSSSKFVDDASTSFMNEGNGIRLADANQFMGTATKSRDNKTIASRGKLNSEFLTRQKDDGSNNVQLSSEAISANPFSDYSRLASRDGGIFDIIWENANPALLFPGMKVKVLYMSSSKLVELHGVLLGAESLTQLDGVGMSANKHICTCHLSVFVNLARK